MTVTFTAAEKLACIERELKQRRKVYERLVLKVKMTPSQAEREIALMAAIADDYRAQIEASPREAGVLL